MNKKNSSKSFTPYNSKSPGLNTWDEGNFKYDKKKPRPSGRGYTGFTLIELLVVIAIIGLLSGIVLVSTKGVLAKARDAKRKSDLDALRTALALYYDKYEHYPRHPFNGSFYNFVLSTASAPWIRDNLNEGSLTEFINPLPVDPINKNPDGPWSSRFVYAYVTDANGKMYDLVAQLENRTDTDRCAQKCWKIYSVSAYYGGTNYYWCSGCGGGTPCSFAPCSGASYIIADH